MKKEILGLKVPKQYKPDLISYQDGLDNVPEIPDYLANGFTLLEAKKIDKLVSIERLKYYYNSAMSDNEVNEFEIAEFKKEIESAIEEYNQM